jgi:hypothetical protein
LISLVPGERFELPTNGLQNRCSTTELCRHFNNLRQELIAIGGGASSMSGSAPIRPTLLAHIGGWPVARQAAGSTGGYLAVIDRRDRSLHN